MGVGRTLLLLALCVLLVGSSHNRGGFISWKITGTNTVTFSFSAAWRAGLPDNIGVYFGDGTTTTYGHSNDVFDGTDLSGQGYNVFENTAVHTYPGTGPYTVYWGTCCRVSTLVNAANGNFRVQTVVDLSSGYDSPTSTVPPLLELPISSSASYQIGVANPSPNGYSCRMATSAESGITSVAAIGSKQLSVSSGCLLTWDTSAGSSGSIYAVSIVISQLGSATTVPLDFIIELVAQSALPTCSVNPYTAVVTVGQSLNVNVIGTSTATGVTSLTATALGLASDATLSPSSGSVPFTVTLSVLPTHTGTYSTAIVFTDSSHSSVTCTVAYQVTAATDCSHVTYNSCTLSNGKTTYSLTSTSNADSLSWSSGCVGSFDSSTSSSVNFQTTANPNSICQFAVDLTSSGVTTTCNVNATCPTCGATATPTCRVDQPATGVVNDPASIDKYSNGDVLAVLSDPDGAIVSATSSDLPDGVGLTPDGQFYVSDQPLLDSGTFNVTVTTTDASGGITTLTITIVLLDITCGLGLTSCGQACYSISAQDCLTYNGRRHICPKDNLICNMVDQCCYDPTTQVCINGSLCPTGNQKCNSDCYDPNNRVCISSLSGDVLCLAGNQLCGSNCYDPTQFWCSNGVMCRTNEASCGTTCYDPNASDCQNNLLVPKGQLFCGPAVYNPATYNCFNGHTLCPTNLQLCGSACYDPNVYVCQPTLLVPGQDFQMCPTAEPELCGIACYNDGEYFCCDPTNNGLCQI